MQHFNLCYGGGDETGIDWYYEWDRWVLKIVEFVIIWVEMVTQVNEHEVWYRKLHPDKLNYDALVHCYGGVNRSGAAIVCLVMWMEQVSLQEGLDRSPNRNYWHKRDYFIPALLFFQHVFAQPLASRPTALRTRLGGLCNQMSLGWWALCQLLQFNGASVLQCKFKWWHWWYMFESHSPRRLKNVAWEASKCVSFP